MNNTVVLIPKDKPWENLFRSLGKMSEDFMTDREQPPLQEREGL